VADRTKRLALWIVALAGLAVVFLSLSGRWLHGHWTDADFQDKLLNFAAVWLPFVLSIIIAFIPSAETRRRAHMRWKVCLIVAGFLTSLVMWRQQTRSMDATRIEREAAAHAQQVAISQAITEAVSKSVEKSSKHSDEHSEQQTAAVKKEMHAEIKQFADAVTGEFTKDASTIAEKAKPVPPGIAKIAFTFGPSGMANVSVKTAHARSVAGVVTFTFTYVNISDVTATNPQIWIRLCPLCDYAKEPDGFTKQADAVRSDRYARPGNLAPSVFITETSLSIAIPDTIKTFEIGFQYACDNCGHVGEFQVLDVIVDR
jgi:hypothetical protein